MTTVRCCCCLRGIFMLTWLLLAIKEKSKKDRKRYR
jgi:hypothetical protein